jgi:hypothetical protein
VFDQSFLSFSEMEDDAGSEAEVVTVEVDADAKLRAHVSDLEEADGDARPSILTKCL